MGTDDPATLLDLARSGDRAALARLLSVVEKGGPEARELGRLVHDQGHEAATVGITGSPGAGKSTLTSALIGQIRQSGSQVAVLAIDPSSPFSGGAILGDRVRMGEHALDEGVFIRSMATRGHLGGLALATPEAVRLLEAVGSPWIIIETVGVGQVEVDVARQADTTVVVVSPGWGDAVQVSKAGLMEIADIFVINKADGPGERETRLDLERMLSMRPGEGWIPPVVSTVATSGHGVDDLWTAILAHREHLVESDELAAQREQRLAGELQRILAERLTARIRELGSGPRFDELVHAVSRGELDPWSAADELLEGG